MIRRLAVAAAALCAAAATVLVAIPAPAAADQCDGVWVVVDATALGGDVTMGCARGDPNSGVAALQGANHTYDVVEAFPAFICRIDGAPTQEDEACKTTPPNSAHWSYWWAEAGGSWTKSSQGAFSRDPKPGQVEGWRFGDGSSPPGATPPAPPPEPKPGPEPDEGPEEVPSSGSGGTGGSRGSGGSGGSDSSGGSGGSGSGSSASSGSSGSPSSGSSGSTASDPNPSAPSPRETSDDPGEEPASGGSIEPAQPAGEVPPDGTAPDPSDAQDAAAAGEDTPPEGDEDASNPAPDDTVALPDRSDEGVPVGLIAGGGVIAGLAGLTALQVRRRRLGD